MSDRDIDEITDEESASYQPGDITQSAAGDSTTKHSKTEIIALIANDSAKLIRNTWTKSKIWEEFYCAEINSKVIKEFAVCKVCKTVLSVPKGTITTLHRHMASHQQGPSGDQTAITSYLSGSKIPKSLRMSLAKTTVHMMALDSQPISIVEDEGFLCVAQALIDLGAKCGSVPVKDVFYDRTTYSKTIIPTIYEESKTALRNELSSIMHAAVTTDHWTDDIQKYSYQAFTVHYINEKGRLTCKCLGVFEFQESKTSVHIKAKSDEVVTEYMPQLSVDSIVYVTDNGANMKAAYKNSHRLSCSAHNLNLVVENAFKSNSIPAIQEMLVTGKEVVGYFKHSGHNKELGHTLKQDVSTRWNSQLFLLQSLDINFTDVTAILLRENQIQKLERLQEIDRKLLADTISFLSPFNKATEELSSEQNVTIHKVLPVFFKLKKLCEVSKNDSKDLIGLKDVFSKFLHQKFEISTHHEVSTVLCPEFKRLQFVDAENRDRIHTLVNDLVIQWYDRNETSTSEPAAKRATSSENFFSDILGEPIVASDISEFKQYLQQESSKMDILSYWECNKTRYPALHSLTMQYLFVPATSCPSERVFSACGLALTERRCRLSSAMLEKLMFLKFNLNL